MKIQTALRAVRGRLTAVLSEKRGRAAVTVLLLIVILAFLWMVWGRGMEVYRGGEDTPYPYFWTVQRDGTVRFSIQRSENAECVWAADSYSEDVITVTQEAEQAGAKNTSFLLTPVEEGATVVRLLCQQSEGGDGYLLELAAVVDEKGDLTLQPEPGQTLETVTGQGTEHCALSWSQDADGTLTVLLAENTGELYLWTAQYDEERFAVSDPMQGPEGYQVQIQPLSEGQSELELTGTPVDTEADDPTIQFKLTLTADSAGKIVVTASSGQETAAGAEMVQTETAE